MIPCAWMRWASMFTLGDLAENVIHVFSWALKRIWRQYHYSKHQIYTIEIMPAQRYGRY